MNEKNVKTYEDYLLLQAWRVKELKAFMDGERDSYTEVESKYEEMQRTKTNAI